MESKKRHVGLSLPAKPEYVGVARLLVAGIARQMNFNEEAVEDIRLATSEACTNIVRHAYEVEDKEENLIRIVCEIDRNELSIEVSDLGKGMSAQKFEEEACRYEPTEGGLGLSIIKALMDNVEFCHDAEIGTRLTIIKYLEPS